jgi:hypothetical protein
MNIFLLEHVHLLAIKLSTCHFISSCNAYIQPKYLYNYALVPLGQAMHALIDTVNDRPCILVCSHWIIYTHVGIGQKLCATNLPNLHVRNRKS